MRLRGLLAFALAACASPPSSALPPPAAPEAAPPSQPTAQPTGAPLPNPSPKPSKATFVFIGNVSIPTADLLELINADDIDDGVAAPNFDDNLEIDMLRVNAAYWDRGFMNAKVEPPERLKTASGTEIRVHISEGPEFRLGRVKVSEVDEHGRRRNMLRGEKQMLALFPPNKKGVFARKDFATGLQAIRTVYLDKGYAYVENDVSTPTDQDDKRVDIAIVLRRGPLVRVAKINIDVSGASRVDPARIQKDVSLTPGDLYNETKLIDSKSRLEASGLFSSVAVSTRHGGAPDTIEITIEVAER